MIGEEQVIAEADRLVANTRFEAQELVTCYDADPSRLTVVQPGVDLDRFRPRRRADRGPASACRSAGTWSSFVGRIQPLKGPDVLISRAGRAARARPGRCR